MDQSLAGAQGFEPRFTDSKSVVLPLDDAPSFFLPKIRSQPSAYLLEVGLLRIASPVISFLAAILISLRFLNWGG